MLQSQDIRTNKDWFEFYIELKDAIGEEAAFIATKSSRSHFFRYCKNPDLVYEDKPCVSPLEKSARHILALHKNGYKEKAIAIANKILEPIGCHVACIEDCFPDKATTREETIDDNQVVNGKLHKAILCGEHPSVVEYIGNEACNEIKQTVFSYKRDFFNPSPKDLEQRR